MMSLWNTARLSSSFGYRFALSNPSAFVGLQANFDGNQTRNMATLKEVKARIRSVKSIQKITKSMKLVATTRLKKAEEAFEKNKPSFLRIDDFLMEMKADAGFSFAEKPEGHRLIVCLTTERGLCGSVNSSVNRIVKRIAGEYESAKIPGTVTYNLLGNKAAQGLVRDCGEFTEWSAKGLGGRSGPKFVDILPVAERLSKAEFDSGTFVRNKFINLLSFQTLEVPLLSKKQLLNLASYAYEYDSGNREETLDNFHQWVTAVSLFSFLAETHCIEIGQRMTSMDNATKNAGELIKRLTMQYNRRRQANITTEITEIVSGAAAVEEDL